MNAANGDVAGSWLGIDNVVLEITGSLPGDLDGDGDVDLFVALRDGPNRLFRNDGGTFTDVTEAAGVKGDHYDLGIAAADYDEAAVDLRNRLTGELAAYLRDPVDAPEGTTLEEGDLVARFVEQIAVVVADAKRRCFVELVGVGPPDIVGLEAAYFHRHFAG